MAWDKYSIKHKIRYRHNPAQTSNPSSAHHLHFHDDKTTDLCPGNPKSTISANPVISGFRDETSKEGLAPANMTLIIE